jgi:hypothetical protein
MRATVRDDPLALECLTLNVLAFYSTIYHLRRRFVPLLAHVSAELTSFCFRIFNFLLAVRPAALDIPTDCLSCMYAFSESLRSACDRDLRALPVPSGKLSSQVYTAANLNPIRLNVPLVGIVLQHEFGTTWPYRTIATLRSSSV